MDVDEASMESDYSDGDDDDYDCDNGIYDDIDVDTSRPVDAEYFDYKLLRVDSVKQLFNESVEALDNEIAVGPAVAKMLLMKNKWNGKEIAIKFHSNRDALLIDSCVISAHPITQQASQVCAVCLEHCSPDNLLGILCGHVFCRECWHCHFEVKIGSGFSTSIECMQKGCQALVPEDFAFKVIVHPKLRQRYQEFAFNDSVRSHPELTFCPGKNCDMIIQASEPKAKRVTCKCGAVFCFECGNDYHAPTNCDTIKKWLTKCADDSETANYICANTKDCPKCHVCIEKNGGCNHMQCYKCKHDFCWICLGDWKTHGSEYYECSRYKEDPNVVNETAQHRAREALRKYLFYFERWENHARSLSLEEQTLERIKGRIDERVQMNAGTWIDWQYLIDAANLLQKCRYTLKYTYPYAYYMEKGKDNKELFEHRQAQLETEVENLSWKIERAEITERGALENQMNVVEQRRLTLLAEFILS